jgi:hypothetical protein
VAASPGLFSTRLQNSQGNALEISTGNVMNNNTGIAIHIDMKKQDKLQLSFSVSWVTK